MKLITEVNGVKSVDVQKKKYIYSLDDDDPKDVVISIMNGVRMESINPNMFNELIKPLICMWTDLNSQRNVAAMKHIEKALGFIYDFGDKLSGKKKMRSKKAKKNGNAYENFQNNELLNLALNNEKLPLLQSQQFDYILNRLTNIVDKSKDLTQKRKAQRALNNMLNINVDYSLRSKPIISNGKESTNIDTVVSESTYDDDHGTDDTQKHCNEQIRQIEERLERDLIRVERQRRNDIRSLERRCWLCLTSIDDRKGGSAINNYLYENPEFIKLKCDVNDQKKLGNTKKYAESKKKLYNYIDTNIVCNKIRFNIGVELEKQRMEAVFSNKQKAKNKYYKNIADKLKLKASDDIADIKNRMTSPSY